MKQSTTYNFTTLWTPPPGLVCVRSSVAWGIDDGILKEYDVDAPRILKPFGLICESESTNVLLNSRDQTESEYTLTNLTTSRDEIGIDAVANTATTITSTAANAVISQETNDNIGNTDIVFSVYMKLKSYTTTATVFLKIEGGGDPVIVSVFPNESGFIRAEVSGVFNTTLFDTICSVLISEADVELVLDQWQLEPGKIASSPIITTSTAVVREAEELYMNVVAEESSSPGTYTNLWFNKDEGVFNLVLTSSNESDGCGIVLQQDDDTGADYLYIGMDRTTTETRLVAGINSVNDYIITDQETTRPDQYVLTLSYKQGEQLFALSNTVPIAPNTQAETFDLSTVTRMWIGNERGTKQINGYIQEVTYISNFMQLSDSVDGLIEQPVVLDAPVLTVDSFDFTEVIFSFTLVKDAVDYILEVAKDSGFTDIIETDISIGATGAYTYVLTTITAEYWFRIRAITEFEQGPYSNSEQVIYP